jgi:hypothetical protein
VKAGTHRCATTGRKYAPLFLGTASSHGTYAPLVSRIDGENAQAHTPEISQRNTISAAAVYPVSDSRCTGFGSRPANRAFSRRRTPSRTPNQRLRRQARAGHHSRRCSVRGGACPGHHNNGSCAVPASARVAAAVRRCLNSKLRVDTRQAPTGATTSMDSWARPQASGFRLARWSLTYIKLPRRVRPSLAGFTLRHLRMVVRISASFRITCAMSRHRCVATDARAFVNSRFVERSASSSYGVVEDREMQRREAKHARVTGSERNIDA